ncbi:unnamed protein product [Caenorhabditis nigoni]
MEDVTLHHFRWRKPVENKNGEIVYKTSETQTTEISKKDVECVANFQKSQESQTEDFMQNGVGDGVKKEIRISKEVLGHIYDFLRDDSKVNYDRLLEFHKFDKVSLETVQKYHVETRNENIILMISNSSRKTLILFGGLSHETFCSHQARAVLCSSSTTSSLPLPVCAISAVFYSSTQFLLGDISGNISMWTKEKMIFENKRIGITVDDPFLVDSFIDKLPSIIMKTVIKNNRKKNMSFMDTAALVQTLISENKAVAEAEQRKKNRSQLNEIYTAEVNNASIQPPASTSGQSSPMPRGQKSYPPHKGGHKTFSQGPTPPWKTNPCKFCDAKHETRNCPLSPQEKRKQLQELNLCGNCLGNSHIAKDCRAKWTCYICHQKHHKSLCLNKGKMDMLINLLNVNNIEDTTEFFRKNGVDV